MQFIPSAGVRDELADLAITLASVIEAIVRSDPTDVRRIGEAYRAGRALMAGIARDAEGSRPRILAGFARYETAKTAGDLAAMGWLLAAIEERLGERDLDGGAELHRIVGGVASLLPHADPTLH